MSITVYSKDNCPACERAKAFLRANGVAFTECNVDHDYDAQDFVIAQGHRAMPVVYCDNQGYIPDIKSLCS
jgi:glutaredoxin